MILADGSFQVFRTIRPRVSDSRMPGKPQTICRPVSGYGAALGERTSRNVRPSPHRIDGLGFVVYRPEDHVHCACEKRRVWARPPQKESGSDQTHPPGAPAQTVGDVYVPVPLRLEQSEVHPGRGSHRMEPRSGRIPSGDAARHGPFITDTAIAGKRSR